MPVPLHDLAAEQSLFAAWIQGELKQLPVNPEWFTGELQVASRIFEKEGLPKSAAEASLVMTQAGLPRVNPRPWFEPLGAFDPQPVAEGLLNLTVRRRLLRAGEDIKQLALEAPKGLRQQVEARYEWAFEPWAASGVSKTEKAHDWLESLIEGKNEASGQMLLWYPLLADMLGPIDPYLMLALVAKPGLGKSALAAQLSLDLAGQGMKVLYASPDMGARKTLTRVVCAHAGVVFKKAWRHSKDKPTLSIQEIKALKQAREDVEQLGILFEDTSNTLDLCTMARTQGVDLLVVDYLGKMTVPGAPGEGFLNQDQATATVFATRSLAGVCATLVLGHTRLGMKPDAEHASWTSELGRQSDTVLWLEESSRMKNIVDCNAVKNRAGGTGSVPFYFLKPLLQFVELRQKAKGMSVL